MLPQGGTVTYFVMKIQEKDEADRSMKMERETGIEPATFSLGS